MHVCVCVGQVYIFLSAIPFPTGNGDKILAVVNYDEKILCKYLRDVAGVRTHATLATFIYIYMYIFVFRRYMYVDLKIIVELRLQSTRCFRISSLYCVRY